MPWTKKDYPASMKNLTTEVRNKAIEIANALLEVNMEEGMAIATAISRAKDWAKNRGMKTKTKEGKANDVKLHGEDRYVIPYQGEWAIRTEKKKRVDRFHYKRDAVSEGRKQARKVRGNLIIQGEDGRVRQKISYNPNRRA